MSEPTPVGPTSNAPSRARLAATYAVNYGVLGAITPYLAVMLQAAGNHGVRMMLAMGATPFVRLVAGPIWGFVADRFRIAHHLLTVGAVLAAAGALLLAVDVRFALPAALLMSLGRTPLDVMLEGITLGALGRDQLAYGRVRLWGSLGFLLASLLAGLAMTDGRFTALQLGAALSLVVLALSLSLPRGDPYRPAPIGPALRALVRHARVPAFLVAAALHFLSHAGATSFLSVHLQAHGAPPYWTGLVVGVGVCAEIGVMANARWLLGRFTADRVILAAVAVGVLRWGLNAVLVDPISVLLIQALHGITFGAWWIAAVNRMQRWAGPEIRTSAQGLLGAAVGGVGNLMGMIIGSYMIEHQTTSALFAVMAGASALALPFAWRACGAPDPDDAAPAGLGEAGR